MKSQKCLLTLLGALACGAQQTTLGYSLQNDTKGTINVWALGRDKIKEVNADSITARNFNMLRASENNVEPNKSTAWNQDHKQLSGSEDVFFIIDSKRWDVGNLAFVTSKRAAITIKEDKDEKGKTFRFVANRCLLNEKTGAWDQCADVDLEVKDAKGNVLYYIDNTPVNACLTQFTGNPFALAKCLQEAAKK